MIIVERIHPDAKLPTRATKRSVGLNLYALLLTDLGRPNKAMIPPRQTKMIRTGIKIQPPWGYYFMIHSRSGLAKQNIFTTTGTIDPDYRGEIQVLLYNGGYEAYYVQHEDCIAQLVLHKYDDWHDLLQLEEGKVDTTARDESGFGSTDR